MKLLQIHVHAEYTDAIDALLDRHDIVDAVRYPRMQGRDRDGKHYGSQVFPGSVTVVQALVPEVSVDALFEALHRFRLEKPAHRHLQAVLLPVERCLEPDLNAGTDGESPARSD